MHRHHAQLVKIHLEGLAKAQLRLLLQAAATAMMILEGLGMVMVWMPHLPARQGVVATYPVGRASQYGTQASTHKTKSQNQPKTNPPSGPTGM